MKGINCIFDHVSLKSRHYLTLLIILTISVSTSFSQNFSGLEGKSLTKIDDIGAGLISLIGSGGLEGKIGKVVVTSDSERTLKFALTYTGFSTAYLHANVLAANKVTQDEVGETEVDLTGKTSPLDLEMDLKDNVPEGFTMESAYLQIRIAKSKTAVGGLVFLFSLDKSWQKAIKAENMILTATLEPVGVTAQLKESSRVLIIPDFKPVIMQQYKTPVTGTATRFQTASAIKDASTTRSKTSISGQDKKQPAAATPSTTVRRMAVMPGAKTKVSTPDKSSGTKMAGSVNEQKTPVAMNAQIMRVNPTLVAGLALDKSETDKGAQGPDNNPIPLFEDLTVTRDFEFPYEITNISMDVFPDKNPASGMFYYMPAAYLLRWTPDDGYAFRVLYGTASGESAGDVRMSATLSPDISKKEIDLISKLLTSYASRNPGMKFNKLRLIPIRENPTVSFPADLNNLYEITADKVSVNLTSSLRDPFQISWVTDNNTKDEMQVSLLERSGIQGVMSLQPQSENIPEINIPVIITLADSRTIGRIDLESKKWRTTAWKNETPYPLKLKYLHMLLVKDEGNKSTPFIYSWNINDLIVPVTASVSFDASNVPSWLDDPDMAQRIWVEYSVADCDDCDREIINTITGGTYGTNTRKVTFETFQLFDNIDAQFIQIKVRSRQGDPKGEKVVEFEPVRIYEDNEVVESGQLYVPLEEELSYEYYITIVLKNGNPYRAEDWISSGEPEIYLGLDAIKNAIPGIPLIEEL